MRAGLIGQNVGNDSAFHYFRQNVRAVADQSNRNRLVIFARDVDQLKRFIERPRDFVAIATLQSLFDPRRIDIDAEKKRAIHGRGERLRAAHSTKSAGHDQFSFERSAEMFAARFGKCLERALHDSLAADVNPRARRHLPVHGEPKAFEPIELGIVRPLPDQI